LSPKKQTKMTKITMKI